MYYTRAVRTRFQQLPACWLSAGVILTAAASQSSLDAAAAWAQAVQSSRIDASTASRIQHLTREYVVHTRTWRPADQAPVELVVLSAAADAASDLAASAQQSLERLAAWLGPLAIDRLTIVDLPVHAGMAGAAYPGIAVTSVRWLTGRRDFTAEREMSAAIARQYGWRLVSGPAPESWLAEGLAAYLATRAEELRFEPRPALTPRFLGGYVPFSIRAVATSAIDPLPRVSGLAGLLRPGDAPWRLARGADLDRAGRLAVALHTLERFIGWPALQAALAAFVQGSAGRNPTIGEFANVVSAQRGADMTWFFDQAMRRPDYAVVSLQTVSVSPAVWQTTVEVRRIGDATFAGTSLPRDVSSARALRVVTRFADGSEVVEPIDGRDTDWRFEYSSKAKATFASVDPDAILLLDADRTNNARAIDSPVSATGMRLALNWIAWLQDAMLACTAVI